MMRWIDNLLCGMFPLRFNVSEYMLHSIDLQFYGQEYIPMDVEVDEYERIMRVVRYSLHFWQNKLSESGRRASKQERSIHDKLETKLTELDRNLLFLTGVCTTFRMTKVMDILKDIRLILEPVIEGSNLATEVESIARPNDFDDILRLLLSDDSSTDSDSPLQVIPIIGMPGSGKTSLVHFLYHSQLVKQHFDHRIWIHWENISRAHSAQELSEIYPIGIIDYPAKNIVVVDDLSNEGGMNCFHLLKPLLSAFAHSKLGTKIIVTSNCTSLESDVLHQLPLPKSAPFPLRLLSFNDTLPFFQSIAFRNLAQEDRNAHLNELALAIFNKCGNNLRVIRIVALILSSQPPPKWKYVNEVLINMPNFDKHILEILDFMQHKKSLNYFSLLPHYEFSKMEFYQLWNVLEDLTKDFEDINTLLGNEYLFQCSRRDKSGVILYYKVHDLVLEVIKLLPKYKEFVVQNPSMERYGLSTHMRLIVDSYWKPPFSLFFLYRVKYLFFSSRKSCGTITISSNLARLFGVQKHALDLAAVNCWDRDIIDYIAESKSLRYLRLGFFPKSLLDCITNLKWLETLDLRHSRVHELPESFHKLHSLRHLYTGDRLIDLPPKFGELTKLETLDVFIVGQNNGVDTLDNFTHLAGNLKIRYQKGREVHKLQEDPTFLYDKNLHDLLLEWPSLDAESGVEENHQNEEAMVLELLQSPSSLKILTIRNWKGEKFPQLVIDNFSNLQSRLVSIHIVDCSQCKRLPSFSKLGCLKFLELWGLISLEWIEISDDNSLVSTETPYFPSLEHLSLFNLPQLKGWSSKMKKQQASCSTLTVLSDLRVSNCPQLLALPLMPNLESLEANNCQRDFLQQFISSHMSPVSSSSSTSIARPILQSLRSVNLTNTSIPDFLECLATLEELSLCWLYNLRTLPDSIGHLIQLRRLVIRYVPNLVDLPESLVGLSALEHVEIRCCPRLKQVPKYFSKLSSLRRLEIKECVNLERRCQESNGEDWPLIQHVTKLNLG